MSMTTYKKSLEQAVHKNTTFEGDDVRSQIVRFSDEMMTAMGLSQADVELACHHQVTWGVGDYIISATSRPWAPARWMVILEVRPRSFPAEFGFSNVATPPTPDGWHYKMQGTATEILPDAITRRQIIKWLYQNKASV